MTLKHLFFSLCLGLLCCTALPVLGDIPLVPPTRPHTGIDCESTSNTYAVVSPRANSIEFNFLRNTDNAQIEVYNAEDVRVYAPQGSVETHNRLKIEADSWKGKYTLCPTMKDKTKVYALNF